MQISTMSLSSELELKQLGLEGVKGREIISVGAGSVCVCVCVCVCVREHLGTNLSENISRI